MAQYAAELEDYEKAIQIYEQVAGTCLDSSLLKYSAKEYFFRAALCHLCVDLLNAQHAMEKYSQQYPAFQDSREYKLVKVMCQNTGDLECIAPFFISNQQHSVHHFTDLVRTSRRAERGRLHRCGERLR